MPFPKSATSNNNTCGLVAALRTSVQLNVSSKSVVPAGESSLRRRSVWAFCSAVKKRDVDGEPGRRKKRTSPKSAVKPPSRKKIQLHDRRCISVKRRRASRRRLTANPPGRPCRSC